MGQKINVTGMVCQLNVLERVQHIVISKILQRWVACDLSNVHKQIHTEVNQKNVTCQVKP